MATAKLPMSVLHGPRIPYSEGERIDALVDRAAIANPEAVALRWRDTSVTYHALVAAADRAAAVLTGQGVVAGDVVVVRAERTPETMTVLLGLLKVGAVYACAPVDWPVGRCRQLVEQTGATVCVASVPGEPVGTATTLTVEEVLALHPDRPVPAARPAPPTSGTDPFCVFLTSGSTGMPKAVLAPHRGVARTAIDIRRLHDAPLTTLQLSSMAWDIFALELWVSLINGGTCVLFDDRYLTGQRLRELVRDGLTMLAIATPLFGMLVDDDPGSLAGLRLVLVGGERLPGGHVARCLRQHPGLQLVNAYGPVENTINSTLWVARTDELADDVPIGTPVTNTSVHLLDEQRAVVPTGHVGEIALSGDGVSLGYLGTGAEANQRFIELQADGAVRAYLTGDLARINDRGQLVFAGRKDRQLKVRGLRIEPEEIERLIESVPGITRAVALALPLDAPNKTRLAAFYLTPHGGVDPQQVRAAITRTLPAGFVPDVLRAVDELPLTANGKADERALAALLPAPAADDSAANEDHDIEAIRSVASELLGYPVAPGDDLFDRGATSLTAMRLATRLSSRFSRTIEVSDIFRTRSPQRIAELLGRAPASPSGTDTGRVDPGPETGYTPHELPFVFGSFWTALRNGARLDEAVVPVIYRLRGTLDAAVLSEALDHLVARHEVLRVRFSSDLEHPQVRVLPAGETTGVLKRQPAVSTLAEAERAATAWAMRPFDLAAGSPIRAALFPAGPHEAVLAISVHHIFFDGWSARLFSEELADAYQALLRGITPQADQPPSYFRVIAAQREQYRKQFPFAVWSRRKRMADAPELTFPLNDRRPWSGPADELPLAVDQELIAEVGAAAAAVQGTAMSVFYAAYVMLLRAYTGAPDPAVAIPVSGRYTEQEATLVGCMAGLLPLRLPTEADTPQVLALTAAEELRAAMKPPLVPMNAIMPKLPDGHRRHPLLQAYLLQEEIPPASMRWGDAEAELIRSPAANAVPELTVELWPHPAVGGVLRYRRDAIPDDDARMLARQFVDNVRQVVQALA
ncbi:tyrocidine synthase 3 [Streptomyces platensis]|uniref:Tyrocidine synthase 3 n=2 Tax=Streptomyces platensis TaxID=58346 RepID=A0ABX3Y3Q0_STRPT|nr:AMP-binding protein [Streptomyces platensis]OSY47383.1 Tyrocidine synthase 3 [Streptomyces platensis]